MFGWLKKDAGKPATPKAGGKTAAEPAYGISLSEGQFTLDYPGQPRVRAALDDIVEVVVETTPGAAGPDVWWLLLGPRNDLLMAFPQSATGRDKVVETLEALAGFDHARLADAISCTIDGEFLVWRRPAGWPRP